VMVDEGRVVSHVGMTEHWASLAGCTVGVACIGAVATYEESRGQGFATQLLEASCKKAQADGMDFMMISGGRGMYRRAGAADVGRDHQCRVTLAQAEALPKADVSVRSYGDADFADCARAYRSRVAHYIRPLEDWQRYLDSRICRCVDTQLTAVLSGGAVCGYFVHHVKREDGATRVLEFAGEQTVLTAALPALMQSDGSAAVELHLQEEDEVLRRLLVQAGVEAKATATLGTLLLLDFDRLMERMHPFFEAQLGREQAKELRCCREGDEFVFRLAGDEHRVNGKMAAAELVFGHPEKAAPEGWLRELFPAPSLWYGISYV